MSRRHREGAEQNRAAAAEHAVSEKATEDRCEINGRGVGTKCGRTKRRAGAPAVEVTKTGEAEDVFDVAREEEILHHVKDQQRLHPVVGKPFPRLGEGEIPKPAWMPPKVGDMFFAGQRRGVLG